LAKLINNVRRTVRIKVEGNAWSNSIFVQYWFRGDIGWSGRSFLLETLRIQLYSWNYWHFTRNTLETR